MAQGTVKHFDASTRTGAVLLDDGTEIALGADAFDRSGLLLLRFGQRVRFELTGSDQPQITSIDLVTMSR
ncbi:MAG: cold-shock protein [Actinomycetota bacterium]